MRAIDTSKGTILIDDEDAHLLAYHWYVNNRGYAICRMKGKNIRLHQCILGRPIQGLEIDHINRNKLDNRRRNLRFVTRSENAKNSDRIEKSGRQSFKGISRQVDQLLTIAGLNPRTGLPT